MNFVSYLNRIYFTNLILIRIQQRYDREINLSENTVSTHNDLPSPKYKLNYPALLIWLLLVIIVLYRVRENMTNILSYVDSNLDTCFQENFCLPVVEMVLINWHPLCHLYFTAFYRVRQKFICYERATTLLTDLQTSATKPLSRSPLYMFVFFHALAIGKSFSRMYEVPFWNCFLEYYLAASLISLYSMIMTFCHIVNRTYESINEQIDGFTDLGKVNELLFTLEAKHWQVGNLSVDLNHCYGPNLLFFWPYNIVGIITLLMNITDYMNQKIHSPGALVHLVQQLIGILVFLCTIIYFSRIGTLMTNEAERTKVCIAKLKLRCENTLNNINKRLIKQFIMKLNARRIQLTASGFLQINMQLLQAFLGLILTYWIVLVQFRTNE